MPPPPDPLKASSALRDMYEALLESDSPDKISPETQMVEYIIANRHIIRSNEWLRSDDMRIILALSKRMDKLEGRSPEQSEAKE